MDYLIDDFYKIEIDSLMKIKNGEAFEISFPLSSIGYSNSRIDLIRDYAQVSYCSERIAPYIKVLNSGYVTRGKYYTDFKIKCIATNAEKLIEDLVFFSKILNYETSEYDDIDKMDFMEEILDFESKFGKKVFMFPELVNSYWANLINGAYWEIASEYYESESKFFNRTYKKYPEHRFGFWKCPQTINFKDLIYFSTENWIIPPKANLVNALKIYSGLDYDLIIEDAEKVDFNGKTILINNSTAVFFDRYSELIHSIKCTERVLMKADDKSTNTQSQSEVLKSREQINLFGEHYYIRKQKDKTQFNDSIHIDYNKIKYRLSEFGDVIIIEYKDYSHVFFSNDTLNFEELKELYSYLYPAYSKMQNIINNSIAGKCNWLELNDDTFEELCYDILYCHPSFDSSTIQKMGKSKSRDGGRDIVIKTKRTPTKEQELYIFQCKYYSDTTSLSASKLPNAGNVIMQYGAKGYGVFTTTVIDSTLYDMLDGFKRNMHIDTSFQWSKYELERYLNRYQMIKRKYFKK